MVRSAKYLFFLFIWYTLSVFATPSLASISSYIFLSFLRFLPFILPSFFKDLFIPLLDNRMVILSYFLAYGSISGLLQTVAVRILKNPKYFCLRWVIASAIGTYLGRLSTELYVDSQVFSSEQLLSGWNKFEPYFTLPILSFFQGIVVFSFPNFNRLSGLIWWVSNSILSVIQLNPFVKSFLSLSEKPENADSLLSPSEGQIFISGLIMIGIILISPKVNEKE
jgi:hypothetical protein